MLLINISIVQCRQHFSSTQVTCYEQILVSAARYTILIPAFEKHMAIINHCLLQRNGMCKPSNTKAEYSSCPLNQNNNNRVAVQPVYKPRLNRPAGAIKPEVISAFINFIKYDCLCGVTRNLACLCFASLTERVTIAFVRFLQFLSLFFVHSYDDAEPEAV